MAQPHSQSNSSTEHPSLYYRWRYAAGRIVEWRLVLFAIALIAIVPAYFRSRELTLDRSLETMFSPSDPVLQDYRFLKDSFGGNEIVLVVYRDRALWTDAGISRVDSLAKELRAIEGVRAVMDLAEMSRLRSALKKTNPATLLSGVLSDSYDILDRDDPLTNKMLQLFSGFTHGKPQAGSSLANHTTSSSDLDPHRTEFAAIACLMDPSPESSRYRVFQIKKMRELLRSVPAEIESPSLVGESIMVNDGFEMVQSDGRRLGYTASIILALLLLIGFRSLRWTLIAVLIVQWSLLVTNGLLWLLGLQLTMVSSMLTSIITVIGVATMIHWMLGYQREMDSGKTPQEALQESLSHLLRPITLACVTDAIGFAALTISKVGPVQDYGLMMAVASLVVLISIVCIVPFLALVGSAGRVLTHLPKELTVRALLAKWLDWVVARRIGTIAAVLVLTIVSIIGALRVRVETNFVRNFRQGSELVRSYEIVERQLDGAGVWDCLLPAPTSLSQSYVDDVLDFENELRQISIPIANNTTADSDSPSNLTVRLTKVLSLFDAVDATADSPIAAALPVDFRIQVMRVQMPEMTDSLLMPSLNSDGDRYVRIMLRAPEQIPATDKEALIESVRNKTKQLVLQPGWQSHFEDTNRAQTARVTGYYILLTQLVESLVADQWICFAVASVAIFLMLWLAIGKSRYALIALVPNLLPPIVVLGFLGFTGWRINLGIAMIAAVSIGISIDSSLHYLSRYRRELHRHGNPKKALKRTHNDVGLAISLATLALILGFGSLVTSDFLPTVAFGSTAALTMLGGLVGNLWLLPALLSFEKK